MALPPPHGPWRQAAALVTVGVFLLAGCGADGTPSTEGAGPPAASSTAGEAEQEPAGEDASALPGPGEDTATPIPSAEGESGGTASAAPEAPEAPEAPAAPAQEYVITLVDFSYEVPATVPPGATITVVNDDSAAHTVTSRGDFDVAVTIGASATFTAPEEPGEYTITCLYHGNMTATLVVG